MALVVILVTPVVLMRTPTDIFPEINIPVIAQVWTYTGLEPQEMEQRITTNVERGITVLVNDIEHIESQSLNGIAIVKIFFHPGVNIQTAMAQVTAISQTFLRSLPPGTTPPLVIIYSASTVPVLQIGLTSDRLSEQQLFERTGGKHHAFIIEAGHQHFDAIADRAEHVVRGKPTSCSPMASAAF